MLEPVGELAEQTHQKFEEYAKYVSAPALACALLVGGCDCRPAEVRISTAA